MIDFACKQFRIDEIIKCGLGLTKAEYKVMEHLISEEEEWFTSDTIAEATHFNLSTIQRSVKKLHEKGIIRRVQENLEGGGYLFQYKANEKPIIRRIIRDIIHSWVDSVDQALERW